MGASGIEPVNRSQTNLPHRQDQAPVPVGHRRDRIYLDHAATGWPKSPTVSVAVKAYLDDVGAAAGRGVYASANDAAAIVQNLRRRLASTIHAPVPDCISLHCSGTAALNAALQGMIRPGDHVVTTAAEHNSVLRPLDHLRVTKNIDLEIAQCDSNGHVSAASILNRVRDDTKIVAVTGASNVTGWASAIKPIAAELRGTSTIVVCDAAQNFGWIPIDVRDGIDVLAAPGHKAGGGPLGTGFLYVAPEYHRTIQPTIFGGTGSQSESMQMPDSMPDKLESGNLNVPALAGWLAGLPDTKTIADHAKIAKRLADQLHHAVAAADCHCTAAGDLPIVSFWSSQIDAAEIAIILATEFGIEVRAGHHCSAMVVDAIGGPACGVVRASAGPETTPDQIQTLAAALREILGPSN